MIHSTEFDHRNAKFTLLIFLCYINQCNTLREFCSCVTGIREVQYKPVSLATNKTDQHRIAIIPKVRE